MKPVQIKRVCVIDSAYSLLLYFLISTEEEIDHTFYFWSKGIPEQVKSYFKNQSFSFNKVFKNRFQLYWYQMKLYHYQATCKWPFLKNKDITYWGHNHLFFSAGIIRKNNINILEDGVRNYHTINHGIKYSCLRKLLFGPISHLAPITGLEKECESLFLTGIENSEIMNYPKTRIISIYDLWNKSLTSKQNKILKIFNLTQEDISLLRNRSEILITQPFSEDKIITEEEKVNLYKDIIQEANISNLIIKPHPREKTDYRTCFSPIPVFTKKIPFQLLSLYGIKFKTAYTICSSAVFDFPYAIQIIYKGSQIHPQIHKAFPKLTAANFDETTKANH